MTSISNLQALRREYYGRYALHCRTNAQELCRNDYLSSPQNPDAPFVQYLELLCTAYEQDTGVKLPKLDDPAFPHPAFGRFAIDLALTKTERIYKTGQNQYWIVMPRR